MTTSSKPALPNGKSPPNRLALLEARLSGIKDDLLERGDSFNAEDPMAVNEVSETVEDEDEVRSFSSDGSLSHPRLSVNMRRRYAPKGKGKEIAGGVKKRKRSSPNGMKNTRLDSYFKTVNKDEAISAPSTPQRGDHAMGRDEEDIAAADAYRYFRERIDQLVEENDKLKESGKEIEALKAENEDLRTQLELEVPDLRREVEEKNLQIAQLSERAEKLGTLVEHIVVELAKAERKDRRLKLAEDSEKLGKPVVERTHTRLLEVWEDGVEWKKLDADVKKVQAERELVEKKRKEMSKKKAIFARIEEKLDDRGEMPPPRSPLMFEETLEYAVEQEELYKVRLGLLRKEENSLTEKRVEFLRERDVMVRELRRQTDERSSSFSGFPLMNERYVLLNLLGRGGFSEVFKAFDIRSANYVACKIHQLASNWSEEKKKSFIRHAWREYKIHKSLQHPRVVKLVDIFEIDENTFCTVLEYVEGCDLDSYLRLYKTLPEKEAKSIMSQVFSGLQYLAQQKRRIIHYDLKPGNILLHNGEVRITDFGLSKVMNETESTSEGMELTSQGAGTMWYLPPECFETGQMARISVKVDVWSAGVILFQMLYGRKPFGHDQSQEKMFREKTVNHQELQFPAKPAASDIAKDFMRKCLTRRAAARPDVHEAMEHAFFKKR